MLLYSLEFYLMKQGATGEKIEYRQWNPFRSKLGAAILVNLMILIFYYKQSGVGDIYMGPGSKVLYIGAASGTTVSHVSDIVGPV